MKSLQEHLTTSIINESVKNLFVDDVSTRRKYSKQVWKILQDAYAPIGGIKGSGFNSIEDMVNNIPFWKLSILNDEVLAVAMYKFEETKTKNVKLRKRVAIGKLYDKSRKDFISAKLINLIKPDFERSIVETSGGSAAFLEKTFDDKFKNFRIPVEQVKKILYDDEIRAINEFDYERKISGSWHQKIMIGTPTKVY